MPCSFVLLGRRISGGVMKRKSIWSASSTRAGKSENREIARRQRACVKSLTAARSWQDDEQQDTTEWQKAGWRKS